MCVLLLGVGIIFELLIFFGTIDDYECMTFIIFALWILALPPTLVMMLLLVLMKNEKRLLLLCKMFLFCLALLYFTAPTFMYGRRVLVDRFFESIRNSGPFIKAIEDYYDKNNAYPLSLTQLPEELQDHAPSQFLWRSSQYLRDTRDSYRLILRKPTDSRILHVYYSDEKTWVCEFEPD